MKEREGGEEGEEEGEQGDPLFLCPLKYELHM